MLRYRAACDNYAVQKTRQKQNDANDGNVEIKAVMLMSLYLLWCGNAFTTALCRMSADPGFGKGSSSVDQGIEIPSGINGSPGEGWGQSPPKRGSLTESSSTTIFARTQWRRQLYGHVGM